MSYRTCQDVLLISTFLLLIACISSPVLQRVVTTKLQQVEIPKVAAATIDKVWVYKKTGVYFCPDSQFYGKFKPGAYMTQEDALQWGYQPAGQQPCR